MGGAAEFPDRASSPLKRRASSMEPETPVAEADADAKEDVDMVSAPPSDVMDTSVPENGSQKDNRGSLNTADPGTSNDTAMSNAILLPSIVTTSALRPPESAEAHVKAIRSFVDEQERNPLQDGQKCFIVSKRWLAKVPDGSSPKQAISDLSSIPPVDNSDIILEVISDPCVGKGVSDPLKKNFVRLKQGYDTEQFQPFPPAAWDLLMQWPGLRQGQLPIVRFAYDNSEQKNGTNIMWEWHPLVLSIHRIWSANSTVPVEASLKASNPPPPRLVRSRTFNYQNFLKQAKAVSKLDLSQRVRAWAVPQRPQAIPVVVAVPTPPTSPPPEQEANTSVDPWNRLLVDVEAFLDLERGVERIMVDFSDLTHSPSATRSTQTLGQLDISMDQAVVIDPHENGTNWTSTFTASKANTSLPTRNNPTGLTVQNRNARSGRTSPVSQGPMTRGRAQKSGRTPGCVGLNNLGNTCYMNAALHCVRSVEELTRYFLAGEWERELNKDNPLAHNGDVAAAYAALLRDLYKESASSAVAPRQFKHTIGRYAASFSGYGQQDSQEFLGFLLDGLQEDLSRIKKKPYIEKPDSTDDMINDPEAIKQMADQVWDITKKRDDSVIADLFTGLYKSTLVCPECGKISITFDPFNNLTLPLPIENKFTHTITFFPLNNRPMNIKVELGKHDSIKGLKQFLAARTGVPVERLFGAEEWRGKFFKHYLDSTGVSEIGNSDNVWFFELESKPTNHPDKDQKQQRVSIPIKSMIEEAEKGASSPKDEEQAERLLVPVFHRRPGPSTFHSHKWVEGCPPHFIVVTPQESRSEDIIRRKILEKVATFTTHPAFARQEESDGSDGTELEIIGVSGSEASSSGDSKIVAQSVKGEDDMVDVQMKDSSDVKDIASRQSATRINNRRPAWINPKKFLNPDLQNLFEMSYFSDGNTIPNGTNTLIDDRDYPKLSSRAQVESPSSEDHPDNATNGTASNDESSSDEAARRNTEMPPTRMNEESDDEDGTRAVKSMAHRPKLRQAKGNNKPVGGRKNIKPHKQYGRKGKKKLRKQQQRIQKERRHSFEAEGSFDSSESAPDGGPLIRFREAVVVDWADAAYDNVFGNQNSATWDECETLPDPDLEKAQAARARRKHQGTTLDECLDEFERDEILSEQDMWYCPRCKKHRRASKKFDLWKTPDILIIHLKRFSSSGYRRDKLEVLVDFPIENLDVTSRVLQRREGQQEVYDLIGVDCHYGGLGGGHYTAHAKSFVDGKWYSYNDSIVSSSSMNGIVDSSAYLLFYRRRSDKPLGGPHFARILERFDEDESDSEPSNSGEVRRVGEGFSRNGSSNAFQEAGAIRLHGNHGGSRRSDDDIPLLGDSRRSTADDEGIDLGEEPVISSGFHPLTTNTWTFQNIPVDEALVSGNDLPDSPLGSGIASDEAQHDSSGDERVLSPIEHNFGPDYPGMSQYELPERASDEQLPPYSNESKGTDLEGDLHQLWGQKNQVLEVPPEGENEHASDEAAEIHLEDDDKIKVE